MTPMDRLVAEVLNEPSVVAAADQLRAGRDGPLPGEDPDEYAARATAALRVIVRVALLRYVDLIVGDEGG